MTLKIIYLKTSRYFTIVVYKFGQNNFRGDLKLIGTDLVIKADGCSLKMVLGNFRDYTGLMHDFAIKCEEEEQ